MDRSFTFYQWKYDQVSDDKPIDLHVLAGRKKEITDLTKTGITEYKVDVGQREQPTPGIERQKSVVTKRRVHKNVKEHPPKVKPMQKSKVQRKRETTNRGSEGECRPTGITDFRYETLRSLGRLLEEDMEAVRSQSSELPVIGSHDDVTSALTRRNSSVEFSGDGVSIRKSKVPNLLPNISERFKRHNDLNKDSSCILIQNQRSVSFIESDNKTSKETHNCTCFPTAMNSAKSSSRSSCASDESVFGDEFYTGDCIANHREQMSRFESLRSTPRSYQSDDFQQYLGDRYLDMYRRRSRGHDFRRSSTSMSNFQEKTATYGNESGRLHNLNHDKSVSLPNISFDKQKTTIDQYMNLPKTGSLNENGYVISIPNSSVPMYDVSYAPSDGMRRSQNRKGIPKHAANRANRRFFHTHGISSLLSELRKSSTNVRGPLGHGLPGVRSVHRRHR